MRSAKSSRRILFTTGPHIPDAFSYGAQVMREYQVPEVKPTKHQLRCEAIAKATKPMTFDEACRLQDQRRLGRVRV
jgi:hypothetical protein